MGSTWMDATRVPQLDKLRSRVVPFAGFITRFRNTQLMSAATHASADLLGATTIAIVVAKRVVVSGLLRRAGCGIGV
jgi:hypothetical protein